MGGKESQPQSAVTTEKTKAHTDPPLDGTIVHEDDSNSAMWGVNEANGSGSNQDNANYQSANPTAKETNPPTQSPTARYVPGPGKWFGDDGKKNEPQQSTPSNTAAPVAKPVESIPDIVVAEIEEVTGSGNFDELAAQQSSSPGPTPSPTKAPVQGHVWGYVPPDNGQPKESQPETPRPSPAPTKAPTIALANEGSEAGYESKPATSQETYKPQASTAPYQYRRRGRPVSSGEAQELAAKWGEWKFVDQKANERPHYDYCGEYPNRDIPWSNFPANAWQVDEDHVSEFLAEGKDLVIRAMEVHLAEYGFGPDDLPGQSFDERVDLSPFKFEIVKDGDVEHRRRLSTGVNDRAGWAPQKSFDGLVRRLLHAVVSGSDFNLVLGGHSAAAGHGYVPCNTSYFCALVIQN